MQIRRTVSAYRSIALFASASLRITLFATPSDFCGCLRKGTVPLHLPCGLSVTVTVMPLSAMMHSVLKTAFCPRAAVIVVMSLSVGARVVTDAVPVAVCKAVPCIQTVFTDLGGSVSRAPRSRGTVLTVLLAEPGSQHGGASKYCDT